MVALIDIRVLAALPGYIYAGYKKNKEEAKAAKIAATVTYRCVP